MTGTREALIKAIAQSIQIAISERTMHHPARKDMAKLDWLWPLAATAALDAALKVLSDLDNAICEAGGAAIDALPDDDINTSFNMAAAAFQAMLKVVAK